MWYFSVVMILTSTNMCGLFYDALGSSGCLVSNVGLIDEWWIGKDVERSDSVIIEVLILEFARRNWGKPSYSVDFYQVFPVVLLPSRTQVMCNLKNMSPWNIFTANKVSNLTKSLEPFLKHKTRYFSLYWILLCTNNIQQCSMFLIQLTLYPI
jgi:hypothetical protein